VRHRNRPMSRVRSTVARRGLARDNRCPRGCTVRLPGVRRPAAAPRFFAPPSKYAQGDMTIPDDSAAQMSIRPLAAHSGAETVQQSKTGLFLLALAPPDQNGIKLRPWPNRRRSFSRSTRRPSVRPGQPDVPRPIAARMTRKRRIANHVMDDCNRRRSAYFIYPPLSCNNIWIEAGELVRTKARLGVGDRYQCSSPSNLRFIVLDKGTI
jgi:hypothetical protein